MIFQGNDITFVHYGEAKERGEAGEKFSVLLQETAWERLDRPGEAATREYLMMALADLQYIIIKAAHSELTVEAGISEITLDIGQDRPTGLEVAGAVEECLCPPGYRGLSCESCAPGYTRSGRGLYLRACQPCQCNGKSDTCDPEVGTCLVREREGGMMSGADVCLL